MTPRVEILNVHAVTRDNYRTEIEVECRYCGAVYKAYTEINSGDKLPGVVLAGYTVSPSEEFVVALHDALHVQAADFVAEELQRIGN